MNSSTQFTPTTNRNVVSLLLIGLMMWLCASQFSSLFSQSLLDLSFRVEMKPVLRLILHCILQIGLFLLFIVVAINMYSKQKSTMNKNKSFLTLLILLFIVFYIFRFITSIYLHPKLTNTAIETVIEYYDAIGFSLLNEICEIALYLSRIGLFLLIIHLSEKKLTQAENHSSSYK